MERRPMKVKIKDSRSAKEQKNANRAKVLLEHQEKTFDIAFQKQIQYPVAGASLGLENGLVLSPHHTGHTLQHQTHYGVGT
jgi:hypothetical protein